jgi:hypothetical protein
MRHKIFMRREWVWLLVLALISVAFPAVERITFPEINTTKSIFFTHGNSLYNVRHCTPCLIINSTIVIMQPTKTTTGWAWRTVAVAGCKIFYRQFYGFKNLLAYVTIPSIAI